MDMTRLHPDKNIVWLYGLKDPFDLLQQTLLPYIKTPGHVYLLDLLLYPTNDFIWKEFCIEQLL